jgi:hypothetical protein
MIEAARTSGTLVNFYQPTRRYNTEDSHLLSVTSVTFPSLCKQTVVVPVFEKGNSAIFSNYRPVSIFNNFSKAFEFIIYDHLFNCLSSDLILLTMAATNVITHQPVWLPYLYLYFYLYSRRDRFCIILFK